MRNLLLGCAAALAFGVAASSASATIVTIDFSGHSNNDVIDSTYDSIGAHFADGAVFLHCGGGCPAPDPYGWFAYNYGSTFTVSFADAQSDVSFQGVSFSDTIADAYDASNLLVAHVEDSEGFPVSEAVNHLAGVGITHIVFSGNAAPTNLTFDSNGGFGVPEPATWAMMLVGFGGLGAMLRRTRTRAPSIA